MRITFHDSRPDQAPCRISYYDVLGVDKMASPVEIRKAYRRRARQLHPDKIGDSARVDEFRQLQKAYDVLNDPNLRPIYDRRVWLFGIFATLRPNEIVLRNRK